MTCPICGQVHEPAYKTIGIRKGSNVWVVHSPCITESQGYVLPAATLALIPEGEV